MSEARGWLPDEVAVMPPGPGLHSVLADADRNQLSDDDLVRMAQSRLRLISHLQAQLLADLRAIGQRCDEVTGRDEAGRRSWAESEVAFAMTWTHYAAGTQLCLAEDCVERLPAVFAALEDGSIDLPKAKVFCDATAGLDTAVARAVVDKVLGEAHKLTTGQLRIRLAKLVLTEDPDVKRRNAKEAVKDRRVWARLTDDGLAELLGLDLPPHRVAAAMERLTAIARAAKTDGDGRKLDQLRADVMLDLLVGDGVAAGGPITPATVGQPDQRSLAPVIAAQGPAQPDPGGVPADSRRGVDERSERSHGPGQSAPPVQGGMTPPNPDDDDTADPDHAELEALRSAGFDQLSPARPVSSGTCTRCGYQQPRSAMPGPRRGVIDLQVPLTTLLGLAEFPGDLAGFGPVIADICRQVVAEQADATWRFSVYDPRGQLIHHGTTRRRPATRDTAFIKARDRTCRAPGCRAPAKYCDVDHTDDWMSSKDSRRCNLACLCRKHHLLKHLDQTGLLQLTPGVLGWTTPLGQCYTTHPEPFTFNTPLAQLCTT
jgi:hypothetical protein